MDIKEIVCEGMDWSNMAQDSEKLRYVDKSPIDSGFYKIRGTAWLAEKLAACEG